MPISRDQEPPTFTYFRQEMDVLRSAVCGDVLAIDAVLDSVALQGPSNFDAIKVLIEIKGRIMLLALRLLSRFPTRWLP
jgi:hypothetical protein